MKGKSKISVGISLVLLLIGFTLGVFLSPRIYSMIPQDVLAVFGVEKTEPISGKETAGGELVEEQKIKEQGGKYTLQIATFSDIESATGLADTLNTRGYSPYIQIANNPDGVLYLLRLGFWTSEEEAKDFAENFTKSEEMKSGVVQID